MHAAVSQARSKLANAVRFGDTKAEEHARRELALSKLEAAIERTLADAPPLTEDQLQRVTAALRPRREVSR